MVLGILPWDWSDFWTGLFSNGLATLIGVAAGVPLALWINRRIEAGRLREDARARVNRRILVLEVLIQEVTHDKELLRQIQDNVSEGMIIYYTLDTDIWPSISREAIEAMSSSEVISKISSLYYEYEHLKRKIDAQFRMFQDHVVSQESARVKAVKQGILDHMPTVIPLTDDVLELLRIEVERLRASLPQT